MFRRGGQQRDQLTGGTGDVNPQIFSSAVTAGTGATGNTTTIYLPTRRLPVVGRAQVLELLKIWLDVHPAWCTVATSTAVGNLPLWACYRVVVRNPGSAAVTSADTSLVASITLTPELTYIGTANQAMSNPHTDGMVQIDLTDGAGHGILIGSDAIYVNGVCANTLINQNNIRFLYRWKEVSLAEYVGMVQSAGG